MRMLFLLLAPIAVAADGDPLSSADRLQAEAGPAIVELEPLAEDLRYLRLPDLVFDLRIEPRCNSEASIRSVLVSVADTQMHLDGERFTDSPALESALVVPHVQAGVLRVDDFCRVGTGVGESRRRIDAAFTARLSLRCASEDRETIAYTTLPLDIVLECRRGETPTDDEMPAELSPP